MPSDRTFVTEVATGLGMLGEPDLPRILADRPPELSNLTVANWNHLASLWNAGGYANDFHAGFHNGHAFLTAPDALNNRHPRIVEWTGGRRPPGDEVVPSDLRVDHVYLVSCKYLSRILHNPSPARLVEGLLTHAPVDLGDWYHRVAHPEYQELYERCLPAVDGPALPHGVGQISGAERIRLVVALKAGWPPGASDAYLRLSAAVAEATAHLWQSRITVRNLEQVLWRILRIGSAPYFILGASPQGSMRLRIDTPWDWRQNFRILGFAVAPQAGGQPRVRWEALYEVRHTSEERVVCGHVEIRWSHGRFGHPPEAKVYLDTPHEEVPGYHAF
jgi:hypothetical protein